MKQLIVIIGPNGVGKSTTAREIVEQCQHTAYVDSDWCRVMNPFTFSPTAKETITENIFCLLQNYLLCDDVQRVIFTHAWHGERKAIYENVIDKLHRTCSFKETVVILKCAEAENRKRALKDGRDEKRVERGMEQTFTYYDLFGYPQMDTTDMTPAQAAQRVMKLFHNDQE